MGIKGLNGFIHRHRILENISVSHTPVVIDGSELMYHLYYDTGNLDFRCGGEYMGLRAITKAFFAVLKQCRIRPYVVFDSFKSENNIERYLENQGKKLAAVKQLSETGESEKRIKPLMASVVLRQTLAEVNVPFVYVPGDADAELASIANEMEAMVLACDTDFCIFFLSHGFLPLSDLQWQEVRGSEKTSCKGKLFRREFLSKICRCPESSLAFLEPLLSSQDGLKGVDFTEFLDGIKETVRIPNHLKKGYLGEIVYLLLWLAKNYRNDEQILNLIEEFQDFPRDKFQECLQTYKNLPKVTNYIEDLQHPDSDSTTRLALSYFQEPDELNVPLSVLPIVIDDQSQESSHDAGKWVRKAEYMLGMFKTGSMGPEEKNDSTNHLLEMDRIGNIYGTRDVSVAVDEQRMRSIFAHLEEDDVAESTKRDEIMRTRKEFLLTEILQSDDYDSLGSLGEENIILESTIKYWGDAQDNKPPDEVRKALAFTLASCYCGVDPKTYSAKFQQIGDSGFSIKALHYSSRWQTLVSEAIRLNKFLDKPSKEPVIGKLFSGKLFQQAHALFERYEDIRYEDAAEELFEKNKDAKNFFVSIMKLFQ